MKFSIFFLLNIFFLNYAYSGNFDSLPRLKYEESSTNPAYKTYKITKYSCPADPKKDTDTLRAIIRKHNAPKLKYCVFSRPAKDEKNMKCKSEVKPIFIPSTQKEELVSCGTSNTQYLYSFAFYRCGTKDNFKEFRTREVRQNLSEYKGIIKIDEAYDLCYDTATNETVWTRNIIEDPIIFDNMKKISEQSGPIKLSTDPFLLEQPPFELIKQIYKDQNDESLYKMQPQFLTPPQHFAFDVWKKTTRHFINTFPLWSKLVPVMTAINIGLRKAQMNLYISNPNAHSVLEFHTRVVRLGSSPSNIPPEQRQSSEYFLQSSIWYKLVHDIATKMALLIYVHNTPPNPPPVKNCSEPVKCEFRSWTSNTGVKDNITGDVLEYAYCCQVTSEQAKEIFFKDIKIEGVLRLNDLIIRTGKRKVRDYPSFRMTRSKMRKSETNEAESVKAETSGSGSKSMEIIKN